MQTDTPLVSVITPVYNGERYLSECIESVLKQTYRNWEYIIVDNCSTDRTPEIIAQYAAQDERIRTVTNERLVDVISNHNIAFDQISSDSNYCKLIQADDWLYPECIESMVDVARASPSVGVVGAYCLAGNRVRCDGLPYSTPVISGSELCHKTLLGQIYLFWSPSCLLIRSDLVHSRKPFYRSSYLNADVDALYELLKNSDFGFVHQVLTYIRVHEQSMTAQDAKRANTQRLSHLHLLSKYGPKYLSDREIEARMDSLFTKYYDSLALAVLDRKEPEFWTYQKKELEKLGYTLNYIRLLKRIFITSISNPGRAARKIMYKYKLRT